MEIKHLEIYEAPTISEFVGNDYLQNIIAKYIAWKINKKVARYNKRIERDRIIRKILTNPPTQL